MTPKQKAELRASEIRKKLSEIAGKDELTDEDRKEISELRTEYQDVETRVQALTISEDEPKTETIDGEQREKNELRAKIRLGSYVEAAKDGLGVDGVEREYNASVGLKPGAFPLELLAPPRIEERATTDTTSQVNSERWVDRLFAQTAAMRLGITFDSVAPGQTSYPITTGGAAAAQVAREAAIGDAAWTVGTTNLDPKRNGVSATFTIEDDARLPGLEAALERDLRAALTEGVDRAIFLGDSGGGRDASITGLMTAGISEIELTQANKVKGPETLAAFTGMVDGIHAGGLGDLRVVASIGAYRLWENTIANAAAENQTLAGFLRAAGLSWMARGELEDATAAGDFGAFVGRGRGIEGAAVAPVWQSAMLIRDVYSGSKSGQVSITLSYLWNFGLPRPSNFQRLKFVA